MSIVLEKLPGYDTKIKKNYWLKKKKEVLASNASWTPKKVQDKISDLREAEAKKLLFDPILKKLHCDPSTIRAKNERNKNRTITDFFFSGDI